MNLYEVVSGGYVLSEMLKHPTMRIKKTSKAFPTLEQAMKATCATVEAVAIRTLAEQVQPAFEEILETQILVDGEWADSDDKDAWESAVDDKVEEAIEYYVPHLSADWLGRNMTACGIHEKDGCSKLAMSLGKEVFKQLTYHKDGETNKSPAQLLSAAGITQDQIEEKLEEHIKAFENGEHDMSTDTTEELNTIIATIAERLGKDFDRMAVNDDFDLASDDDDTLAGGAGARLGLDDAQIKVLQGVRFEQEDNTADYLSDLLEKAVAGGKKAPAKKPAAAKAAPAAPKTAKPVKEEAEDPAAEAEGGMVNAEVLGKLKLLGVKDDETAKGLGVSRATYNNWANGKTSFELNNDQTVFIRELIVERINTMHECLAVVDGTEAEVII